VGCNQFAEAAAIDVVHFREIEDNLVFARIERFVDDLTESRRRVAESNRALEVHHDHVADLPIEVLEGHAATVPRSFPSVNANRASL